MERFRVLMVVSRFGRCVAGFLVLATALSSGVVPQPVSAATPQLAPSTLGMFLGFDQGGRHQHYEQALGSPIRWVITMADHRSPSAMRSSVWGQFTSAEAYLPKVAYRTNVTVSVPLAFGTANALTAAGREQVRKNLLDTASGKFDADYRAVARQLIAAGYPDAMLRLGHEFDGEWYPWSARGNNTQYIAAFRHVHDVFAAESASFRFEWTGLRTGFLTHGPPAYPGDAYVDSVGLDLYYRESTDITDRVWTNQYMPVLQGHLAFATTRNKPVSFTEWGIAKHDVPRFIALMHSWFASLPTSGSGSLLYQSYFSPPGAEHNLDLFPTSKQRYLDLFGGVGAAPPVRLVDTRGSGLVGAVDGSGEVLRFGVSGRAGLPSSGIGAVALNVTVTDGVAPLVGGGYVTVFECGARPNASNLNFEPGQVVANSVVTPVSASGEVCVFVYGLANVLVDVSGYLPMETGFGAVTPARLVDTRPVGKVGAADGSGEVLRVQVSGRAGLPASGVGAVALNVTVTDGEVPLVGGGYVTVFECGRRPEASNLNFGAGQVVANSVVAPVSASGEVCVYVYGRANVLVDVSGFFSVGTGFGAVTPARLADTRLSGKVGAADGGGVPLMINVSGRAGLPMSGIGAVALNVTVTDGEAPLVGGGYVTVFECAPRPEASTLNFEPGQVVANSVVVPVSATGQVCVYVYGRANVLVDVSGFLAA